MIISFSGTSGSGKSTIIAEIKKKFYFKGKKVIVREEDSFFAIKLFKYLLGDNIFYKYKEEKYFKKKYDGTMYKLFSTFCYIFYPIIVYLEYLGDYIRYQFLSTGTVLILDRYMFDYAVTFKNALGIDNKFVEWFYNHPMRPYLSFLIDINLTTALKRNKNNIPGKITSESLFHENVLSNYQKIAKKHNLLVIENNGNLKDAVEQISTYIFNKEKLLKAKKITISGLDGVGKTTVANLLAKYASSLNIKYSIVHFYHENLLFKLLVFIGYYRTDKSKDFLYKRSRDRSEIERLNQTPFILALLRFLDSYVQYLFSISLNRSKLIIFDRYFYDYLVSFEYLNIEPRSFYSKLIPPIKNKFLFESSPMTSYERKPESVQEFFVECHEIYLKVAKEQNIKIIKTENKKPEDILQELIGELN